MKLIKFILSFKDQNIGYCNPKKPDIIPKAAMVVNTTMFNKGVFTMLNLSLAKLKLNKKIFKDKKFDLMQYFEWLHSEKSCQVLEESTANVLVDQNQSTVINIENQANQTKQNLNEGENKSPLNSSVNPNLLTVTIFNTQQSRDSTKSTETENEKTNICQQSQEKLIYYFPTNSMPLDIFIRSGLSNKLLLSLIDQVETTLEERSIDNLYFCDFKIKHEESIIFLCRRDSQELIERLIPYCELKFYNFKRFFDFAISKACNNEGVASGLFKMFLFVARRDLKDQIEYNIKMKKPAVIGIEMSFFAEEVKNPLLSNDKKIESNESIPKPQAKENELINFVKEIVEGYSLNQTEVFDPSFYLKKFAQLNWWQLFKENFDYLKFDVYREVGRDKDEYGKINLLSFFFEFICEYRPQFKDKRFILPFLLCFFLHIF